MTSTVQVTSIEGITAPGHCGLRLSAPVMALHTAVTALVAAITVTESGQQARIPRRRQLRGQRHSALNHQGGRVGRIQRGQRRHTRLFP
jgi:hypothetical protein